MKKEMINTFLLIFATFVITTITTSVSPNVSIKLNKLHKDVTCEDYLGLEKLFSYATTVDGQVIPLNIKRQCNKKGDENFVRKKDF